MTEEFQFHPASNCGEQVWVAQELWKSWEAGVVIAFGGSVPVWVSEAQGDRAGDGK